MCLCIDSSLFGPIPLSCGTYRYNASHYSIANQQTLLYSQVIPCTHWTVLLTPLPHSCQPHPPYLHTRPHRCLLLPPSTPTDLSPHRKLSFSPSPFSPATDLLPPSVLHNLSLVRSISANCLSIRSAAARSSAAWAEAPVETATPAARLPAAANNAAAAPVPDNAPTHSTR